MLCMMRMCGQKVEKDMGGWPRQFYKVSRVVVVMW